MERQSVWLAAAQAVTVAAGLSVAACAAAASAVADVGPSSDPGSHSVSAAREARGPKAADKPARADKRRMANKTAAPGGEAAADRPGANRRAADTVGTRTQGESRTADATGTAVARGDDRSAATADDVASTEPAAPTAQPVDAQAVPARTGSEATAAEAVTATANGTAVRARAVGAVARTAARSVATAADTVTATAAAPRPTLVGTISGFVFGVITALERVLTGPAKVPAGSTVTVRSSSLSVGGLTVPADWYFPDSGDPPQRLILLQHGFFATGAMYSTTAAELAEQTNSIVVVPTLSSNPFADGGLWVNGVGMQKAVAALFAGDRAALTASAMAAGYAQQYGLGPAVAELPRKFVLAGHSAGGALVSVAAGYIVGSDAADDLMGVLLLDAVTADGQLSTTLTALDDYQGRTGRYIPVREIGAPPSAWNFISNVNSALAAARPQHFNGVVLSGGVHTDSMGGGGGPAEFLYHLVAGFPKARNTAAVQQLAVEWVDDWFAGVTDAGDGLAPGSTIAISTAAGTAVGTVIGRPSAASASIRAADLAA